MPAASVPIKIAIKVIAASARPVWASARNDGKNTRQPTGRPARRQDRQIASEVERLRANVVQSGYELDRPGGARFCPALSISVAGILLVM